MFLYEELLNMFDQLHEGSEDPQIQTVCCIKRATIHLCYVLIFLFLLIYYHLLIQSFITISHLCNVLTYFIIYIILLFDHSFIYYFMMFLYRCISN